jgi:hypothetical protein
MNSGTLRIIAMPALAYGVLPNAITDINSRCRQIKISVEMGT